MKSSFFCAALLCAVAGLNSCRDDTKELLKNIDGQWELKSVQFTNKTSGDSTVAPSQTYLTFESCSKSSNSGGPGNCAMHYRTGSTNYDFTYQATDGKKTLYVTPTTSQDPIYQQIASIVSGSYEVITLASSSLVIRKKNNCTGSTQTCDYVQLTATK